MIRMLKLCLLSALALALFAPVSQAAVSDVSVLGNGNLTVAGGAGSSTWWENGKKSIDGTWLDLMVEDTVCDVDAVTDSGSASDSYVLKGFWTGAGYESTVTANLTVIELLCTDNLGDIASDDITITLALFNMDGDLLDSDVFALANSVQDGADLDLSTDVMLSVMTPADASLLGEKKSAVEIVLTVEGAVSAFADGCCPPDDGGTTPPPNDGGSTPPAVPAPGAIALASLGMGLVNWLRTRRTL